MVTRSSANCVPNRAMVAVPYYILRYTWPIGAGGGGVGGCSSRSQPSPMIVAYRLSAQMVGKKFVYRRNVSREIRARVSRRQALLQQPPARRGSGSSSSSNSNTG